MGGPSPFVCLGKTDEFALASAVTAHGAAVDSAGLKWSFAMEPLTKLLNLNLRYQTRNFAQSWSRWYSWPFDRVREMTIDRAYITRRSNTLKISDGGHYDNLGVVALAKRRVKSILVFDVSADPGYAYGSLEKCRRRLDKAGYVWKFDGTSDAIYRASKADKQKKVSPPQSAVLVASISAKSSTDPYVAKVYYCKSSCHAANDPPYVTRFKNQGKKRSRGFPHTTTLRQCFDWSLFEAYRQLGYHIAEEALTKAGGSL